MKITWIRLQKHWILHFCLSLDPPHLQNASFFQTSHPQFVMQGSVEFFQSQAQDKIVSSSGDISQLCSQCSLNLLQFKNTECCLLTSLFQRNTTLPQFKSHMFSFTFVIINAITTWQALTSHHWKAESCLSLCCGIWVGTADMLSKVSAPHRGTHHYHHHLPLPPSLSVCLSLSLAACCPQLMERQSHCWLITLEEGETVWPSKSRWHCSGSILPIRKLRNTRTSPWKKKLIGRWKKKLEEDKHKGH